MQQLSIFDTFQTTDNQLDLKSKTINNISELTQIKGLIYIPEYITQEEHSVLWKSVNSEKWLDDLKRRVQQ